MKVESNLMHFGIRGMHWGIRRYQNQDGTLTEEGKKRYSNAQKQIEESGLSDRFSKRDTERFSAIWSPHKQKVVLNYMKRFKNLSYNQAWNNITVGSIMPFLIAYNGVKLFKMI